MGNDSCGAGTVYTDISIGPSTPPILHRSFTARATATATVAKRQSAFHESYNYGPETVFNGQKATEDVWGGRLDPVVLLW